MRTALEIDPALAVFHPLVGRWFAERLGTPTEIQRLAWPRIAAGEHLLVSAPTGSGKTLTAFLWALDQLLTGAWSGERVRVLYVSPLRALNNDVQRNLLAPLAELEAYFAAEGEAARPVRVAARSGDTPSSERQRMLRHPPEVLITTPESLNILLTSKGGRSLFDGVRAVVLDEIHAVAATKRGTHLMTGVERLVLLGGELQRIALSATVRPAERIARFVGGYEMPAGEGPYRARPVAVVTSRAPKGYDLRVWAAGDEGGKPETPAPDGGAGDDRGWEPIVGELKRRIRQNRSTLLFANSRRTTEKVTRLLNEEERDELAYSHHGSLSREIRAVVEERLKEGRLQAIVATNSLELGIDVGALDEVLLLQTPPTIASAVQRLGRAGHGVGEVSRGRLFPIFDRDFLDAAVVARAVVEQDVEEIRPVGAALDVLAQVIVSMVAAEEWDTDELYRFLRSIAPYHELSRRQYELVLEMLAGRYADSRIRELKPRIAIDRVENRLRARRGSARLIYLSGGTIPDRGYFNLRLADSMAKIGELDEEFVWERSLGDTFNLGAQSWRIQAITHNDVLVAPGRGLASMAPFWRAEERDRSYHLSGRIGEFLERAEGFLGGPGGGGELVEYLAREHALEPAAGRSLVDFLERQRAATGSALPHRRHLLIEVAAEPDPRSDRTPILFHTVWGGRVNRPLALALSAAWEEMRGYPLEVEHDNDCLIVYLSESFDPEEILGLVRPDAVERLLARRLERTGFFGARFRENAGRALLLPRAGFRRRVPLWFNRQRAKKLLEAVSRYDDFPVVAETWRTCLQDEFDLESLKRVLAEVERGEVKVSRVTTSAPSPFAGGIVWKQTNRWMYEDDTPEGGAPSRLAGDLLRELVFSSQLRPRLPDELIDRLVRKLHRTHPGYPPTDATELVEWVKERRAIPLDEWRQLGAAIESERPEGGDAATEAGGKLVAVRLAPAGTGETHSGLVAAVESLPSLARALGLPLEALALTAAFGRDEPPPAEALAALARLAAGAGPAAPGEGEESDPLADLLQEWLRYYGPVPRELLAQTFALPAARLDEALETLVAAEHVVVDQFRAASEALEICDAENLERLLRLLRAEGRRPFEARPLAELPLFLAVHQGLAATDGGPDGLKEALERLFGYPAPARLWEGDLLPSRLDPYYTSWLDGLMQESDLVWLGVGDERLSFALAGDVELFRGSAAEVADGGEAETETGLAELFPEERSTHVAFESLLERHGPSSAELSRRLWHLAWQGRITNSTFLAVRKGILAGFEPADLDDDRRPSPPARSASRRRSRAVRFDRWRASRPFAGDWFRLDRGDEESLDALDREELNKERVRILLDRYGVLFRELLARELPGLTWSRLFRSLRLMELSGEVLAGRFFDGVPGLQFASPAAFRRLEAGLPSDVIYWMNALDPASPCGLGLEGFQGRFPRRVPSNHLVFHGAELAVVSRRHGGELEVRVGVEHPHLEEYFGFLKVLLTRQFDPRRALTVETINGEPAAKSAYAGVLGRGFSATKEQRGLKLRRRY